MLVAVLAVSHVFAAEEASSVGLAPSARQQARVTNFLALMTAKIKAYATEDAEMSLNLALQYIASGDYAKATEQITAYERQSSAAGLKVPQEMTRLKSQIAAMASVVSNPTPATP